MACMRSGRQAQVAAVVGVHACGDQVLRPLAVAGVRGRQLQVGLQFVDLGDLQVQVCSPSGNCPAGACVPSTCAHLAERLSGVGSLLLEFACPHPSDACLQLDSRFISDSRIISGAKLHRRRDWIDCWPLHS